jgi:alcohol dehydrogenase
MLSRSSRMGARVALERDAGLRARRLAAAAGARGAQRLRRSRPTMRGLVARPGGRIEWRALPSPPPPRPDAAVVHPVAVATCDLDRALALGTTPFPLPLHLGHECVAEVLSVGDQVATVRPGQRVVVPFQISCGGCAPCRAGLTANCASVPPLSMYGFGVGGGHWGGALADQLTVPYADGMLVPLPAGIDAAAAASVADNVCDGYRHVAPHLPSLLERDPDTTVLIVAAVGRRPRFSGSIALYAGLTARALGARRVHLVDSRAGLRAHAERLGLRASEPSELKEQEPAPLVVAAGGTARGLRAALTATAPDGVCSSVGGLHATARIPTGLMYARNASYHVGRTHARALIPEVLELIEQGRLRPGDVTTRVAAIDEAPTVVREHVLGDATKTVLTERR